MSNKNILHQESHVLPVNVYLLFNGYIFAILLVANILPVTTVTYYIFLFLGTTGIFILLVKPRYRVIINNSKLELSINIPFKVTLFATGLSGVKEITNMGISAVKAGGSFAEHRSKIYYMNRGSAVKLTMRDNKIIIISGVDADKIIEKIQQITGDHISNQD